MASRATAMATTIRFAWARVRRKPLVETVPASVFDIVAPPSKARVPLALGMRADLGRVILSCPVRPAAEWNGIGCAGKGLQKKVSLCKPATDGGFDEKCDTSGTLG